MNAKEIAEEYLKQCQSHTENIVTLGITDIAIAMQAYLDLLAKQEGAVLVPEENLKKVREYLGALQLIGIGDNGKATKMLSMIAKEKP